VAWLSAHKQWPRDCECLVFCVGLRCPGDVSAALPAHLCRAADRSGCFNQESSSTIRTKTRDSCYCYCYCYCYSKHYDTTVRRPYYYIRAQKHAVVLVARLNAVV
jgi:hypothetical protein